MNDPEISPSILVVDDTPANLEILSQMLKKAGHRARPVASGEMALRAAEHEPPALVLLDINMPGMDGFETCKAFKSNTKLADIPILFISARSDPYDKLKAFEAGGVDYVIKPFDASEVIARVETHLTLRRLSLELEEKNNRLQGSYDELQTLESQRDNLVHMVVHDMRTPITVLQMVLENLRDGPAKSLESGVQAEIQDACRSTDTLIKLANDLLDISRFEKGKMPISFSLFDVETEIHEVVTSHRHLLEDRKIGIEVTGQSQVCCDSSIINRVITNLISNAVKFTPSDGHIDVSAEQLGKQLKVTVKDDGIGISEQFHQSIFEKFGQATPDCDMPSVGLGLAFCKLAVEAHGGHLGIESTLGTGSTFWFEIPDQNQEVS